jgi:hypothetical protein
MVKLKTNVINVLYNIMSFDVHLYTYIGTIIKYDWVN